MAKLNIEISDELNDFLVTIAKQRDIQEDDIVRKALLTYLEELKEDIEDYNDAIEILAQKNPSYSLEEVMAELGIAKE